MPNIHSILKNYWGYDSFRPLQEEIITAVLQGKDTLALLPTGGGKSICFQVPAMAKKGLCLVVSPLIALMKDQVESLRRKGITAFAIYSGMSRKEVMNALQVATESNCKFLYVSPERLETALFKEYLPALPIHLIAIDEAHCISQWGYDFRPPYLRIAALREELPGIPILALTASATPVVQEDICAKLEFTGRTIFRQSFERPNLSYSLFEEEAKINKIVDILRKVPGSGIIYCKSRKRTKAFSDQLNMQGISADYYHAGLPTEERNTKQEAWVKNQTRIIVCTNAFGMGIDKPDVRTVIHADVPDYMENYYQEAGRAGRDGKKAYAVLLYDSTELDNLKEQPDIRFPSLDNIRQVYQSIVNYLQIPSDSGEGVYYDFDFTEFVNRFNQDARLVTYAIEALEQDGWVSFNEQVFLPSRARFITNKEWLYEFERSNPALEPLIQSLLRSYEGIFDMTVSIHEKTLAYVLRKEVPDIIRQLTLLDANAIIEYQPQKDKPQLYFIRPRVKAEHLRMDMTSYEKRKELCRERIDTMIRYVREQRQCRSQYIAAYFGDDKVRDCGICDNCRNRENGTLTAEEFSQLHQQIMGIVGRNTIHAQELLKQFSSSRKEKVLQVLNFLQAERKITVSEKGMVRIPITSADQGD